MQAQWSAHSLRTRLPEPQVWGGWGPTPKERNSFSSSRISRINARVRSAGVSPTPPQIPHNADHATSVGIRAGHPPAASSRGRAPRPHAAAPLVRSSSHGRGLGTRISGLHTAYPIVIRLTCSAVGRKPQLPYHSNSISLHSRCNSISLHSRCTSIGLHSQCSSTCATASLPVPLPAATPSVRGRRAPPSVHARESEDTHYTPTTPAPRSCIWNGPAVAAS